MTGLSHISKLKASLRASCLDFGLTVGWCFFAFDNTQHTIFLTSSPPIHTHTHALNYQYQKTKKKGKKSHDMVLRS